MSLNFKSPQKIEIKVMHTMETMSNSILTMENIAKSHFSSVISSH